MSLAQSTARTVMLKLFLTSDHVTAATGKTLAITISKAGGAFGNPNAGASNATEVASGWYSFALDTTDTNTLGDLVVRGTAASCDDAERIFEVVSATTGGATNLDAAISSRLASASYTAPDNTSITAIKTKTDFLPSATAGAAGGLFIAGTNAATTVTTSFTTTFTGNLTGSVGSLTTNNDKTGYSLSQTFPTNFSSLAITVGGAVTAGTISDKTGYSLVAGYDLAKTASQAGDAMTLTAGAVDAILDDPTDGATTFRQLARGMSAALLGKASGLATTAAVYRDVNDTKNRISATVDADGNRTAVTLDLT